MWPWSKKKAEPPKDAPRESEASDGNTLREGDVMCFRGTFYRLKRKVIEETFVSLEYVATMTGNVGMFSIVDALPDVIWVNKAPFYFTSYVINTSIPRPTLTSTYERGRAA